MIGLPTDRPPFHPGEILLEEFLEPYGMSQTELAKRIQVSYPRVNEIVHGKRGITTDTACRLAKLFGTTPDFWLNMQQDWDLWHTLHDPDVVHVVEEIETLGGAAA